MFTIFMVGTFWFWFLLTIAFGIIVALSEEAAPGWATAVALLTAFLLQFFGGVPISTWLLHHPKEFFLYLFAYLLAGVIYSIVKWTSFVRQHFAQYKTPLQVDSHSTRIIGWMSFWPCNLVWTVINDPVKRLFEFLFEKTKSLFQRIADRAYTNANPPFRDVKRS